MRKNKKIHMFTQGFFFWTEMLCRTVIVMRQMNELFIERIIEGKGKG